MKFKLSKDIVQDLNGLIHDIGIGLSTISMVFLIMIFIPPGDNASLKIAVAESQSVPLMITLIVLLIVGFFMTGIRIWRPRKAE